MKTINLTIDKYIVECKIKKVNNSLGDIILLIGANTFSGNYFLFQKYFKYHNLIIINTPSHGKTTGYGIESANKYLDFYENCILELINKKYCSNHINIVGYSLGGMTLYHLVQRDLLKKYIKNFILLFSAYKIDQDKIDKIKQKLQKSKANINDIILCESFNELSNNVLYKNKCTCKSLIIGSDDCFFSINNILITRHRLSSKFINIKNSSHFSPLINPKKYVLLIESHFLDNII